MSKDWLTAPPSFRPPVIALLEALDEHVQHVEGFVRARLRKEDDAAEAMKRHADETYNRVWARLGEVPLSDETYVWCHSLANLTAQYMGWPALRPWPSPKTGQDHETAYKVRQALGVARGTIAAALDEWRNPIPTPPDFHKAPTPGVEVA